MKVTKEQLEEMYWGRRMSQEAIAKELGLSQGGIGKMMRKLGIQIRTVGEAHAGIEIVKITKEELVELYCNQEKSMFYIAKQYGVSPTTIGDRLKKYDIKIRPLKKDAMNQLITREVLLDLYCNKKLTQKEIASQYRTSIWVIQYLIQNMQIPKKPVASKKIRNPREKTGHITKEQLEDMYWRRGMTQKAIAKELGLSEGTVARVMIKMSIPTRTSGQRIFSEEHKSNISLAKKGKKSPLFGKKSKPHGKRYYVKCPNGETVSMRSTWEVCYAMLLNDKNIYWEYEPKTFNFQSGEAYTPDFYVHSEMGNYFVEVKGWMTEGHKHKIDSFRRECLDETLIIADIKYLKNIGCDLKNTVLEIADRPQNQCENCGQLFYTYQKSQIFCSNKCKGAGIRKDDYISRNINGNRIKRSYKSNQKGQMNNGAKLNEQQVLEIVQRKKEGESIESISRHYSVGWTTISHILKGRSWTHITNGLI